ncbi:ankyrin repeat-containing domain protein [Hypomontagnella monticulosa]|nr:ankyrin repeat-containing domain protein [Hypomontagnella monticulosa]
MADVLTVVGGVASISQIIISLAHTSQCVITFCKDVSQAPNILREINQKLSFLREILEHVQSCLIFGNDVDVISSDTGQMLGRAILHVQLNLREAQLKCQKVTDSDIRKARNRIKWVLKDRAVLKKLLEELSASDRILQNVIQIIILKVSIITCQASSSIANHHTSRSRSGPRNQQSRHKATFVSLSPWLMRMGFYANLVTRSSRRCWIEAYVSLGYKFPSWFLAKSIDFEFRFSLPRYITLQNRVNISSSFMTACSQGNVCKIRVCLAERSGSVRDRSLCTGKTPLLLAVEGGHVEAVKLLLEAGADPNIGDDNRLLPVFCALGMNPGRHKRFIQLPPRNESWIAILRLLIDHNASVHEIVHGRSLTTLNLISNTRPQTLEFFRLLSDEFYDDFDACHRTCYSAASNALRSGASALDCLKALKKSELDFSRLFPDGKSLIHLAAEYSCNADVLDYICANCPRDYINLRDSFGWTALHYGMASEVLGSAQMPLTKLRLLIKRGASPSIDATYHPLFSRLLKMESPDRCSCFEISQKLKSHLYEGFIDILQDSGCDIPADAFLEIFHDAK